MCALTGAAYNPVMGHPRSGATIDACLRDGGWVVTANDRAARALQLGFHERRRAEGLQAWPTPNILDWSNLVRRLLREHSSGDYMLLNSAQETALWTDILGRESEQHLLTVLPPSRIRLARLASSAHDLICSYAPRFLAESTRRSWDADAAVFSRWLAAFDATSRREMFLSPGRAPLVVADALRSVPAQRPPLLVVGFDRILPAQRALFDAWGPWQPLALDTPAIQPRFFAARDEHSELAACAHWCANHLAANPQSRVLVVSQNVASRRGEIERAFLGTSVAGTPLAFEFSLGISLAQVDLVRADFFILRWLKGTLAEHEIDWLFSTGLFDPQESTALQRCMRALRRRNLASPDWTLDAFTTQLAGEERPPSSWLQRIKETRRLLDSVRAREQSPLDWAGLVPRLLQSAGLTAARPLSSPEFQAWTRFQQALETSASLGFTNRAMAWPAFLDSLRQILNDTLFAPESIDAPVLITGPAETAGLEADAIWFLGADEDAWPAAGSTNPLLPFSLQREYNLPHSSAQSDYDLTFAMSTRLIASAPVVHFSYARLKGDTEARPSFVLTRLAGAPADLPSNWTSPEAATPLTVSFEDIAALPYPADRVSGGSNVLTTQSQCPFKAFATARLNAEGWEHAEAGLTPAQRGLLLHSVLHSIWAGPPRGIRSQAELLALLDLDSFVGDHVQTALRDRIVAGVRERMPQRYLDLEALRLTRLIAEWLRFESARIPFTVEQTESKREVNIAGLTLDLRLDRIDRLADGALAVIDYKTGDVKTSAWQLPRPDDVQLPLYAVFGLDERAGGLLFAKVRTGNLEFAGHVADARATLLPGLTNQSPLVKSRLTQDQISGWKAKIEELARDFLAGVATIGPRDYPKTCESCDLQVLCRIVENAPSRDKKELGEEDADA